MNTDVDEPTRRQGLGNDLRRAPGGVPAREPQLPEIDTIRLVQWRAVTWSPRAAAMSDVTRILSAIDQGDPAAAEQLLPLVYLCSCQAGIS